MHIQAVFMDRDGTLGGSDEVIYPGEFKLFPNVIEALQQLKKYNILLCSFTNQPGISKGEATFNSFHKELKGFGFNQIYLCPHQHHEGCECRKPSSGMLRMAAKDNDLDLSRCVVIGDRWTDLIAANDVGCQKILVKTGNGKNDYQKYVNNAFFGLWREVKPDFVAEDVKEAIDWLVSIINKNER